MKRRLFVLIIVLTVLAFVGCQSEGSKQPGGFEKQEDTIVWDAVEGADSYVIEIGDELYTVGEPSFSVQNHPNGSYTMMVRTKTGTTMSDAAVFDFTIDRPFEIPANIRIEDGDLVWDAVDHAAGYEVLIGNDVHSTDENTYALNDLDAYRLYQIRVRSVYESGVSNDSLPLYHHTYPDAEVTHSVDYVKGNYGDPAVVLTEGTIADYIRFDDEYFTGEERFTQDGTDVLLASDWLNTLETGDHMLYLLTSEGMQTVELSVSVDDKPYIITDNSRDYSGDDLVFEFELYEGSITDVSQTDLTDDDYVIDGDTLTIKSSYIDRILDDNSDRETVILSYQLENADQVVLGYIFIHLQD